MNKDRIKGAARKIKGSVEKAVGKLVGNKKLEARGKMDQAAGNIRKAVGDGKDIARNIAKNRGR